MGLPRSPLKAFDGIAEDEDVAHLRDMASEVPVIRLVNQMLVRALESRASDVHIEPFENQLKVRYRIDGILHEVESPPRQIEGRGDFAVKISRPAQYRRAALAAGRPDQNLIGRQRYRFANRNGADALRRKRGNPTARARTDFYPIGDYGISAGAVSRSTR